MAIQDCIFCSLPREGSGANILYRDEHVYVIRDINPSAPVHLLIIPLRHIVSLAPSRPEETTIMGHMFAVAEEMAIREGVEQRGYRLIVNQGPDSGQGIAHVHMHLLAGRPLAPLG